MVLGIQTWREGPASPALPRAGDGSRGRNAGNPAGYGAALDGPSLAGEKLSAAVGADPTPAMPGQASQSKRATVSDEAVPFGELARVLNVVLEAVDQLPGVPADAGLRRAAGMC